MQVWGLVPLLVGYIVEGKIDNELRLTAALDFLLKMKPGAVIEDVSKSELDAAAGVGVEVTPEQVEAAVEEALGAVNEEVVAALAALPTPARDSLVVRLEEALSWMSPDQMVGLFWNMHYTAPSAAAGV